MKNLKIERIRKGMTQKELASALGLRASHTVANWESGRRLPSPKQLIELADFFDCSIDYLLGRSEARA